MSVSAGTRLGPYEILGLVGAGGMGEVYRARDGRLGREVAVKVLPEDVGRDPERLARFGREARAVAALNHPGILTVHDVGTHNGTPYVVTELLEGETLRKILRRRPPTQRQALSFAVQAARGLEAAHAKGVVHRDLKPENLFLTKDGRLKILDFGLAKVVSAATAGSHEATASSPSKPGQMLGTVDYMSPEQVRGRPLDGRTDLFSLGVVLYELLGGRHPFARKTGVATLAAILEETPSELPKVSPALGRIVARCLEKLPDDRITSAHDLAVALEAIQTEPRGVDLATRLEERGPYPGLRSFMEDDAGRFFGREGQVEALWRRLRERRLLAVIGPSGAGKTSFVRAGVVAMRPSGWAATVTTPGTSPLSMLGQALAPDLAGDPKALRQLVRFEDPETAFEVIVRWRQAHTEALLVVDQLEELFTLNAKEAQGRFAAFLGRLAKDGDVHVLLSMRDDFLMRCGEHQELAPVFTELTPLLLMGRDALWRALVEPAKQEGYRFEDDALVREMVEALEGVRGALPLLAFAAARLWEKRDRERKLLSRAAYQEMGGVAGALAQHAEAAMDRIGAGRQAIVREIFRNLVTAEGTRAVMEREELLSVFPERKDAEEVLRQLVGERLLTTYEVEGQDGEASHQRVEVVHESLLREWPRLVRWQAQDEEGAVLRDQLKQAARLWESKGRSPDVLWSGTTFREFELWRERYTGKLTALEEDFARSMTERAWRRKKLRRAAVASVMMALSAVAIAIGLSRQEAMRALDQAQVEARQREAAEVLVLGRLRLEDYPSAALAHAIASLERADSIAARRFAVEALWKGPPAMVDSTAAGLGFAKWSRDGRWLALGSTRGVTVLGDTGGRHLLGSSGEAPVGFSSDGTRLVSRSLAAASEVHLWSLPEARLVETWPPAVRLIPVLKDRRLLTLRFDDTNPPADRSALVHERSIDGGPEKVLGRWRPRGLADWDIDREGASDRLFSLQDGRLLEQRLDRLQAPPRVLGRHDGATLVTWPWKGRLLTSAPTGDVRIWDVASGRVQRTLRGPANTHLVEWDLLGRFVAAGTGTAVPPGPFVLFDLLAPRAANPVRLAQKDPWLSGMAFHPQGGWLATNHNGKSVLWNLAARRATILPVPEGGNIAVAFTHDARLVSASNGGVVRQWSLDPAAGEPVRELWARRDAPFVGLLELDARDRFAVFARLFTGGQIFVQPLDGSPARQFSLQGRRPTVGAASLDPSGRVFALASYEQGNPQTGSIRLLDLASGDERDLRAADGAGACARVLAQFGSAETPAWLPDGRLISDGATGLRIWDLATGTSRQIRSCRLGGGQDILVRPTPDGKETVSLALGGQDTASSGLFVTDLATGATRDITSHGARMTAFALDRTGKLLVTGDRDGVVRVGPLSGEEPHLLYGHTRDVSSVAVSPDGRWIASGSDDETIRLWPMPEGPPLHTLPHDRLLTKLRSLTNLRVVPDAGSATGYKLEPGPFPSWKEVPTW